MENNSLVVMREGRCHLDDNNSTRKLRIKKPISTIVSLCLMFINLALVSRTLWTARDSISGYILSIGLGFLVLLIGYIVYSLVTFRSKSLDITLTENGVLIKDQIIPSEQIDKIMVDGYFKPTYGIKLVDMRYVPAYLCFKFAENIEMLEKHLFNWAERNKIEICKKKGPWRLI